MRHSRLARTAGAAPGGVFTSDLWVSEYVLLGGVRAGHLRLPHHAPVGRRLGDEHRLPATTPKPTFTLGLDA